jgi:hypothetical protein
MKMYVEPNNEQNEKKIPKALTNNLCELQNLNSSLNFNMI